MTLSVRNVEAVKANLRQYGEGAKARAKVVVQDSADRLYGTAQQLCPVDTGFMKAHMLKEFTPAGFGYQVGFRGSDFPTPYFIYQEFGTRFMPAQPCIFPARDLERPRFRRDLAEALRPL
jgi:HK97 gp10 family phage protein